MLSRRHDLAARFGLRVSIPALPASGLPKGASLHTLRHNYGSVLLADGVDLATVSETSGPLLGPRDCGHLLARATRARPGSRTTVGRVHASERRLARGARRARKPALYGASPKNRNAPATKSCCQDFSAVQPGHSALFLCEQYAVQHVGAQLDEPHSSVIAESGSRPTVTGLCETITFDEKPDVLRGSEE